MSHRGKSSPKKNRIKKVCLICGKEFEAQKCHSFVKTCSRQCGYKLSRITPRKKRQETIVRICICCGKEFVSPKRRPRKYCTMKCYLAFVSRNVKYPDKQRLQNVEWRAARDVIIRRDSGICFLCGEKGSEVHHKIPYSISGDNNFGNLVLLCPACHLQIHRIISEAKTRDYLPAQPDEEPGLVLVLRRNPLITEKLEVRP